MTKKALEEKADVEEVVVKRKGELRQELSSGKSGSTGAYWINHEGLFSFRAKDIGKAVKEAGYEVGDKVEYKVIIPKKKK